MTTEAAAKQYLDEHITQHRDKGYAIFNPHNVQISELPVIYGFNNGGNEYFLSAVLLAEDGTELGGHTCSDEGYMLHDLGILEGTRPDRHKKFKEHYPNGYRMDFVPYDDIEEHSDFRNVLERAKALQQQTKQGEATK